MQFGRVIGLCLIGLGVVLLAFQAYWFLSIRQGMRVERQSPGASEQGYKSTPLPGIVGVALIVGGLGVFSKARRAYEPDPRHAVK